MTSEQAPLKTDPEKRKKKKKYVTALGGPGAGLYPAFLQRPHSQVLSLQVLPCASLSNLPPPLLSASSCPSIAFLSLLFQSCVPLGQGQFLAREF